MKKQFFFVAFILFALIFVSGCATGSGTVTILDPNFNPVNSKISLLPPRFRFESSGSIEVGSEQNIGRMIYNSLYQRTSTDWLSPDESVSLIQDANVLDAYESLLDGYQKTGIPSKAKLTTLSKALNCPYLALCQIDHRVTGVIGMSGYRHASITIQVLSAKNGKVVLELIGNAECGSGSYDIGATSLMKKAIDEVTSCFPGAKPSGN